MSVLNLYLLIFSFFISCNSARAVNVTVIGKTLIKLKFDRLPNNEKFSVNDENYEDEFIGLTDDSSSDSQEPDDNDNAEIGDESDKDSEENDDDINPITYSRLFKCSVEGCDKSYCYRTGLHRHMINKHHKKSNSHEAEKRELKIYLCPHPDCDKVHKSPSALFYHNKKAHEENFNYSCSQCHKTFTQSCSLIVHLRTHTGEKPFSCSICGKSFSQKCNRNQHEKIHKKKLL